VRVLPWVVLVSALTSLATVAAVELLREPRVDAAAGAAAGRATVRPVAPRPESRETLAPAVRVPLPPPDGWEARLVELERRMSSLESTRQAAPTAPPPVDLPSRSELRDLVLDWVAQEREARGQARELEQEDEKRAKLEFDARFQAHMLAQEHGLAEWQEKEFAALFLEIGERTAEIEAGIDPAVDDPREVEARWVEFDEWVDQRERELTARIDPALYEKIYGER